MKKKIKVVLSNNEVFYCTRPWYFFWLMDGIGSHAYLDEDGQEIKIGNHWWIYQKKRRSPGPLHPKQANNR